VTDFIVRTFRCHYDGPVHSVDIRCYFTARGKLRFILEDVLDALVPNRRTNSALRDIRKDHIRPLSRNDATETVSRIGMNVLALNTRYGDGLAYIDFLKALPRMSDQAVSA
jgi:hypothetical protein